jgi:lipopolysaccharide transport system ATP-binding protein
MKTISVRGLTKEFKLGARRGQYQMIHEWFSLRRRKQAARSSTSFLALDDISFDAEPGEVIGVIGRNGAGKSTLLKILARILRPTRGRVELRGRVGSLLEVGSGFHGELTGRENIFLNAAILGMQHREIVLKLDEIVDFAGVGQYLDEPVKTYSSGMYMRLAFSVAAHIEPEILLVDEVLAVGDAEFQKKCMRRIEQVGKHGQTVLFVSHNSQAVLRLCSRALLIDQGRLVQAGPAHQVAATYLTTGGANQGERIYPEGPYAPGDGVVKLRSVRVRSRANQTLATVELGEELGLEMEFDVQDTSLALFPVLSVRNEWGAEVLWATDAGTEWHGRSRPLGRYRVIAWIPPNFLSAGAMTVTAGAYSFLPRVEHFNEVDAVGFQAVDTLGAGTARGDFTGHIGAATRPKLEWTVDYQGRGTGTNSAPVSASRTDHVV